jgi:acyl carrier protein
MSEFYEGMAEVLEVDISEIKFEFELATVDWNSMAIVSTVIY